MAASSFVKRVKSNNAIHIPLTITVLHQGRIAFKLAGVGHFQGCAAGDSVA